MFGMMELMLPSTVLTQEFTALLQSYNSYPADETLKIFFAHVGGLFAYSLLANLQGVAKMGTAALKPL